MILTGELSPRIDISEKQLQQELGISRTPVHEALKRLQDEGFVETYARKGTFVADVTIETVQDIYETRLLIEPFMTKNARENMWLRFQTAAKKQTFIFSRWKSFF